MELSRIDKRSVPCWTVKDGKVIAELSIANLCLKTGLNRMTVTSARRKNAGKQVFMACGYEIHMELHESLKPSEEPRIETLSRSDGPLLWRPVTHRLGYCERWA